MWFCLLRKFTIQIIAKRTQISLIAFVFYSMVWSVGHFISCKSDRIYFKQRTLETNKLQQSSGLQWRSVVWLPQESLPSSAVLSECFRWICYLSRTLKKFAFKIATLFWRAIASTFIYIWTFPVGGKTLGISEALPRGMAPTTENTAVESGHQNNTYDIVICGTDPMFGSFTLGGNRSERPS